MNKKRILIVNTKYREYGGEDSNILEEVKLLKKYYEVEYLSYDNKEKLQQRQWLTPLGTLAQTAQAAGVSSPAVVVVGHVLSGLAKLQPQPARHSA